MGPNWGNESSSSAEYLFFGSRVKQYPITSARSLEKCFGNLGYSPFTTLACKSAIFLAKNGGFKDVSSYITQPRDQISHFLLYGSSFHTSGGQ